MTDITHHFAPANPSPYYTAAGERALVGGGQGRSGWTPVKGEAGSERGIGIAAMTLLFLFLIVAGLVLAVIYYCIFGGVH